MKKHLAAAAAWGLLWAGTTIAQAQGSLSPPGAPAATMKSLDQIEPRTVITNLPWTASAPGGYVVDRNLSLASGTGISVTASDVTIDLNGFVLTGDPLGGGHGIHVATDADNVTIKNGVLRDWGADGLHAARTDNLRIDNLRVHGCAGDGIEMSRGEVSGIVLSGNDGSGLRLLNDPIPGIDIIVEKKPSGPIKIVNNGGGGVVAESPGSVELTGDVSGNTGHGISWVSAEADADHRLRLAGVACEKNTGDGIHVNLTGAAAREDLKIGSIEGEEKESNRVSGNGGHGVLATASADADVTLSFASVAFDDNGGDGVRVSLPHADSRLRLMHRGGSAAGNVGDGYNVLAAGLRAADQGFFDVVVARNGGSGFVEDCASFSPARMEGVSAHDNGVKGLDLHGKGWLLARSDVTGNGAGGIRYQARGYGGKPYTGLSLEGCRIDRNSGNGVEVVASDPGATCTVQVGTRPTSISGNTGHGLFAHAEAADSVLKLDWQDSHADGNGQNGVHLECDAGAGGVELAMDGGTCDRNTGAGLRVINEEGIKVYPAPVKKISASGNGGSGVHVQGGIWRFSECRAAGNGGDGIRAELAKIYDRWGELIFETNDLVGNTGAGLNIPTGGAITGTVTVVGGSVSLNATAGIIIADNGVKPGSVNRVNVTGNGGHGIAVAGHDFRIEDNLVARNAGSGIRVTGSGAHVARNQCSGNVTGVELVGTDNAARENIFGGDAAQTPIDAAVGNAVAPTQDVDTGTNPLGNVAY